MDDINNKSRGSGRFRFTEPGKSSAGLNSPEVKSPRQSPQRSEPQIHEDFRDLYKPDKPAKKTVKSKKSKSAKPRSSKSSGKKLFLFIVWIMIMAGAGAGAWYNLKSKKSQPETASTQQATKEPEVQKLSGNFRILASGDMIIHDSVYQNAKKASGTYDFEPMLSELKPILSGSQARICHNTVPATGGNISGYPSFNAPSELIGSLSVSGCNVLSLASDHINDKGQEAIDSTLTTVEKDKNIVISDGANKSAKDQAEEKYFNIGDGQVKFAYFSYTNRQSKPISNSFGVNVYDEAKVKARIQKVRSTADLIIVSICWGKEDSGAIQPEQDKIAQEMTDAGADVIFGHCPHVIQPVKKLKSNDGKRESIVYYSLGNALNTQLPLETLIGGLAVVNLDLETKKITNFGFMPTYMHYDWPAADKAARNLGARKNLKLYPLDKASDVLKNSHHNTSAQAQNEKVKKILNQFTPTKIFTSNELRAE